MADNTRIEWTDATWNVVIGCDKVSPGCDRCYAIRTAHRMQANPNTKVSKPYAGTESGGEWTGRVNLVHDRLDLPMRWRRPRRIFVNAQSDLFHDQIPDEYIARVFAVMAYSYWHTFQILTKRHGRMRSLLSSDKFVDLFDREFCKIPDWNDRYPDLDFAPAGHNDHLMNGPLTNVWGGVSAEDQQTARLRIPALVQTPFAVRFVSCEPLLGYIDLDLIRHYETDCHNCSGLPSPAHLPSCGIEPGEGWGIDWVIAGGESGAGARPMHPDWARSLRDQCRAAGVAFHFKQFGEWVEDVTQYPADPEIGIEEPYRVLNVPRDTKDAKRCALHGAGMTAMTKDNPFNPFERGHPGWTAMRRVGKKAAGRELDGRTWDEFPEAVRV